MFFNILEQHRKKLWVITKVAIGLDPVAPNIADEIYGKIFNKNPENVDFTGVAPT